MHDIVRIGYHKKRKKKNQKTKTMKKKVHPLYLHTLNSHENYIKRKFINSNAEQLKNKVNEAWIEKNIGKEEGR